MKHLNCCTVRYPKSSPVSDFTKVLVAYTFFALSDDAPSKKMPCSHIPKKPHLKLVGRPATELVAQRPHGSTRDFPREWWLTS